MGLVQSNIVDYERLRRERGAAAVVREVLDVHYAMTYDAVERSTPTRCCGRRPCTPRPSATRRASRRRARPRDPRHRRRGRRAVRVRHLRPRRAGEYNAAAFVAPGTGLLGFYRKTRLFPLTSTCPLARRPDAAGAGCPGPARGGRARRARVFPLRLADGREIPVLPMICLDDMDAGLAIDGARLGAQAILTMSNDCWFTADRRARSCTSRRRRFAASRRGCRSFASPPTATAPSSMRPAACSPERAGTSARSWSATCRSASRRATLLVAWGDWVGLAGAGIPRVARGRGGAARWRLRGRACSPRRSRRPRSRPRGRAAACRARGAGGACVAFARGSLLWMARGVPARQRPCADEHAGADPHFAALFLGPEAAVVRPACIRRTRIDRRRRCSCCTRGARRIELAARDIVAVEPWRVPLPASAASLRLASGERWHLELANVDAAALARRWSRPAARRHGTARRRGRDVCAGGPWRPHPRTLSRPLPKFVVLPLLLAIPRSGCTSTSAYGGSASVEYFHLRPRRLPTTFALWWAALGRSASCFAAPRAAGPGSEAGTPGGVVAAAPRGRWSRGTGSSAAALAMLLLGLPAWLLLRIRRCLTARRSWALEAGGLSARVAWDHYALGTKTMVQVDCGHPRRDLLQSRAWRSGAGRPGEMQVATPPVQAVTQPVFATPSTNSVDLGRPGDRPGGNHRVAAPPIVARTARPSASTVRPSEFGRKLVEAKDLRTFVIEALKHPEKRRRLTTPRSR
jgi:apolipoprotein N-acyltransferase